MSFHQPIDARAHALFKVHQPIVLNSPFAMLPDHHPIVELLELVCIWLFVPHAIVALFDDVIKLFNPRHIDQFVNNLPIKLLFVLKLNA